MSHRENRSRNRNSAGFWLPLALGSSLTLALTAQAQVNKDRTRPPQPSPPPASTSSPPPRQSTPSPSPPPSRPPASTPAPAPSPRSTGSGGGSGRTSEPPPARSGNPGKGADFDALFGGSKASSGDSSSRTSHSSEAADKLNKANSTNDGNRTRPTTSSGRGTTLTGAQNGAVLDRFQRTREGAIFNTPPPAEVIFVPRYPYYPYHSPYDGYEYPSPWPSPYPWPGPYPRPDPFPRRDPDDGKNPDEYRIGEQDKKVDPLAEKAVQELRTAWLESDIELLSKHIRRDIEIEIFVARQLEKTQDASDFLSDARYAFDTKTVRFEIESITPITRRIYKVVAHRTTRDTKGFEQTVTIRYVLEKMDGVYIITRVETED